MCPRWSEWNQWGECNQVCRGTRVRNRLCIGGVSGDFGCEGPMEETEECDREVSALFCKIVHVTT